MKENELVPKRRFGSYIKKWELNKLKQLADFSKGSGYSKKDIKGNGNPIILYGHLYTNYQSYIKTVNVYAYRKEKSVISQGYEVIVPSSGETAEDIVRASVVAEAGVILGGDLNIIIPHSQLDPLFLALNISNGSMKKELIKCVQGISVVHLYNSDIKEITLSYPSKEEQQKIGRFFKLLDERIALQERKVEKTKALKAAYLAEMFPAEGERIPKRRFAGFTDEWERCRLEDLAEVRTGKAFKSTDFKIDGEYLVVTNKNIQDQASDNVAAGDRIDISEETVLNNYLLNGDNILVTMDGVNIGKTGKYSNEKGVLAQRVGRINSEQLEFVYQITSNNKFISEMNRLSVGNAIKHISLKQISDFSFMAPKSKKEQHQIGEFFKQLDDIISNYEHKLDKLKATKQAYLNEMFV